MKLRYKVTIFIAVFAILFAVIALNIDKILPKVADIYFSFFKESASKSTTIEPQINFLIYDGFYDKIGDLIIVNNSPVYSAKIDDKWFIIQNKKKSDKNYDKITGLTAAGTEFGFVGKQKGRWYIIYKGREIGGPYEEIIDGLSSAEIFGFTGNNFIYTETTLPKLNPNCEGDCGHREPYTSAFVFNNGTKIPYSWGKNMELQKTIINEHPPIRLERNIYSQDEAYYGSVNSKNILVTNEFGYRLQYGNKFVVVPDESGRESSVFRSQFKLLNEINGKFLFVVDVSNPYVLTEPQRWGVFIEP